MKANLALILATLLWGLWGLADKKAISLAHPYTVQWMYAIPYVVALPVWYWLGSRTGGVTANHNSAALLWAVLASGASLVATILLFFALQRQSASLATAATSAYPVVTMVLAIFSGNEDFSVPRLAGILLIIVGIVVVQVTGG